MATKKRIDFYTSEAGLEARDLLIKMAADNGFNTQAIYSANSEQYPNNLIPFVDKHMAYLNVHPDIEPRDYISNLRLMTRMRS